jgi:hypothetical protein
MASAILAALRVWQETSYLDLAENGDPSTTVPGSAVALDCNRAEITAYGEPAANPRETVRSGPYHVADDPETVPDSTGALIKRRVGDVTLTMPLEGLGSGDSDDNPFCWLLASGFADSGADLANETVVAHASAQTFTVADNSKYPRGLLIQALGLQAAAQFSAVVDASTVNVQHSPAFSAELDDTVVRLCRTFGSVLGAPGTVLGPSLGFCGDYGGGRTFARGARLKTLTISGTNRRVDATAMTFGSPLIYDDHASSDVYQTPYRSGAKVLHTLHADPILSNAIATGGTYPRIAGRTSLPIGEWSIAITLTHAPLTDWRNCAGQSDTEITDVDAVVTLTLDTPIAALTADWRNRVQRQLMIPFGPAGAGQGAAFYLPGAVLTSDPDIRDRSGVIVRQTLVYRPGMWGGDVGAGSLKNSPMRLGFSL